MMFTTKKHFLIILLAVTFGCKNNNKTVQITENKITRGQVTAIKKTPEKEAPAAKMLATNQVIDTFRALSQTDSFLKGIGLEADGANGRVTTYDRRVLIGDLNDDGLSDAIMPYTVEGQGGANNWSAQYAVFINTGKKLEYKCTFYCGGNMAETLINFQEIKNGIILGATIKNDDTETEMNYPKYIYRNGKLERLD